MNDVRTRTVVCNTVTCASSWKYTLECYYDARTHEH